MYNSINAQKDESMIHNKSPKSKQRSSGFTALTKGKVTSSGMSDKKAKGKHKGGCVSQCCYLF